VWGESFPFCGVDSGEGAKMCGKDFRGLSRKEPDVGKGDVEIGEFPMPRNCVTAECGVEQSGMCCGSGADVKLSSQSLGVVREGRQQMLLRCTLNRLGAIAPFMEKKL